MSGTVRRQDDLVALSRWFAHARHVLGLTEMGAWVLLGCPLWPRAAGTARWLGIGLDTVKNHRTAVYAKVRTTDMNQAAVLAWRLAVAAYASLADDVARESAWRHRPGAGPHRPPRA